MRAATRSLRSLHSPSLLRPMRQFSTKKLGERFCVYWNPPPWLDKMVVFASGTTMGALGLGCVFAGTMGTIMVTEEVGKRVVNSSYNPLRSIREKAKNYERPHFEMTEMPEEFGYGVGMLCARKVPPLSQTSIEKVQRIREFTLNSFVFLVGASLLVMGAFGFAQTGNRCVRISNVAWASSFVMLGGGMCMGAVKLNLN